MAKRLEVDGESVVLVQVRDSVTAMCEVMHAAGRNRSSDFDYLRKKGPMLAVEVEEVYHLVGLPGIRPLSKDSVEVIGKPEGIVVEADPDKGFVKRI